MLYHNRILLILIIKILVHLLRNKNILRPIIILILILAPTIRLPHRNIPRRHNPAIRLHSLDLRLGHLIHVLAQMFYILHLGFALYRRSLLGRSLCFTEHFVGDEGELVGALEEDVEGGFELEDGFEDGAAAEDVEAQTGAREGDGEAPDVAEVADCAGAD